MGRGTYVGALGSCPTRRTESMVLCECVYVRRKGGRGDVCKSKCVCVCKDREKQEATLSCQSKRACVMGYMVRLCAPMDICVRVKCMFLF